MSDAAAHGWPPRPDLPGWDVPASTFLGVRSVVTYITPAERLVPVQFVGKAVLDSITFPTVDRPTTPAILPPPMVARALHHLETLHFVERIASATAIRTAASTVEDVVLDGTSTEGAGA
ncbi:hypothetical protein ACWERI_38270 [Streptomyces collinus]